ncbi:MAG: sulfurtransferase complex subunit TusB [Gammaproteobacteria bacterium]|nr:MAG: sulfurtransferase complex subunit TusB [Gammaproteobacteria bacterium]
MLHTINKSPFMSNSLNECLRVAKDGSAILLIEDGVYAALKGSKFADVMSNAMGKHEVYALGPDLDARGLSGKVIDGIKVVDYGGFVDLAAEQPRVQAWL